MDTTMKAQAMNTATVKPRTIDKGRIAETTAIIVALIAVLGFMTTNINRQFDNVNRQFDELKSDVNRQFDELNRQFDELKSDVNRQFDDVKNDIRALNNRIDNILLNDQQNPVQ